MLEIPEIIVKVKIKKVNIGTKANLLQEYQDLFPMKFVEIKGILRDLGVMRIPSKVDAKPLKQRPSRLNPRYKEKARQELDKMIITGIIEPVDESEWVSPMVV